MIRRVQVGLGLRGRRDDNNAVQDIMMAPLLARIRDLEAQLATAYNERLAVEEKLHDQQETIEKFKTEVMYLIEELEMKCRDMLR